jgi:hypothetical protein
MLFLCREKRRRPLSQRRIAKAAVGSEDLRPESDSGSEDAFLDESLLELECAADQTLGWLLSNGQQQHEEELDEMMEYDEFGDEEYASMYKQVHRREYGVCVGGHQLSGQPERGWTFGAPPPFTNNAT